MGGAEASPKQKTPCALGTPNVKVLICSSELPPRKKKSAPHSLVLASPPHPGQGAAAGPVAAVPKGQPHPSPVPQFPLPVSAAEPRLMQFTLGTPSPLGGGGSCSGSVTAESCTQRSASPHLLLTPKKGCFGMETRWRTHRLRTHSSPDTFGVTPGLAGQLQTQPRLPCGRASQRGAVNSTAPRRGRAGDALQSPAVENLTALSTLDWVPAKHLSGIDGAPRPAAARWPVEMGRAPGLVAAPAPAAPPWCINHRDGTWGNAGGTARGPLSLGASPGATSSELRAGSPTSPLFQPRA